MSGRTTKRVNPTDHLALFSPINGENSAQKLGGGKCQNPVQAIIRIKKKKEKTGAWTTKTLGWGG